MPRGMVVGMVLLPPSSNWGVINRCQDGAGPSWFGRGLVWLSVAWLVGVCVCVCARASAKSALMGTCGWGCHRAGPCPD